MGVKLRKSIRFDLKQVSSLKLTATLPLKMDGWNTTVVSFWGPAYFHMRTVSFRECSFSTEIELVTPEKRVNRPPWSSFVMKFRHQQVGTCCKEFTSI